MRPALSTHDAVWQHPVIDHLNAALHDFPPQTQFVVGCSGGRDSMLLLVLLQRLCPQRLRVIYINHQLHPDAAAWGQQVQHWCDTQQVPCQQIAVVVGAGNLEQAAREARYQAFDQQLRTDEVLVLGHHQQDQAETVLMRLCAGGSIQAVAGMRAWYRRGHYWVWRPLLDWSRTQIDQCIQQSAVPVVDDPANHDAQFDRVWLRQQVWPVLQARWSGAVQGIGRFAQHVQDAQSILHEVLLHDWQACRIGDDLSMRALAALSLARQRQLLTWWLQGAAPYAPPQSRISTLLSWLQPDALRMDAVPEVDWQEWRVYGYRQVYYRVRMPLAAASERRLPLQAEQIWALACGRFRIWSTNLQPPDLMIGQMIHLRGRQAGERLQMSGKTQHSSLKKLLQSWDILPWQRQTVTLWCVDEVVLGVFCPDQFYRTDAATLPLAGWQVEPISHDIQ